MGKPKRMEKVTEIPPDAAPGEYGPITWPDYLELPEDVRMRRAKRAYEMLLTLKGKVHIKLDIDEARGRHRR